MVFVNTKYNNRYTLRRKASLALRQMLSALRIAFPLCVHFVNIFFFGDYMARSNKVCAVCLGKADTTLHQCNGNFGDKNCSDWLHGWFLVDETVERAARAKINVSKNTSHNSGYETALCVYEEYIDSVTDGNRYAGFYLFCKHRLNAEKDPHCT